MTIVRDKGKPAMAGAGHKTVQEITLYDPFGRPDDMRGVFVERVWEAARPIGAFLVNGYVTVAMETFVEPVGSGEMVDRSFHVIRAGDTFPRGKFGVRFIGTVVHKDHNMDMDTAYYVYEEAD